LSGSSTARSVSFSPIATHYRSNCSLGESVVDEVMPVETFAEDRKEQLSRLDASRVDGITNSDVFKVE